MSGNLDEYVVIGAQSLGRSIREFRRRRHISQQTLAEQVGVHRSYLSEMESGATTEALDRISRDQEHVASLAIRHNLSAIPIVDAQHTLLGVVPPQALLEVLRHEHPDKRIQHIR